MDSIDQALARECSYLFVDKTKQSLQVFETVKELNKSMITIGESPEFVDEGGLLSLVSEAERVKIYINRIRYKAAPVKFSATLLKFANFTR